MKLRAPTDLIGGVLLFVFGVAVIIASRRYEYGSLDAMGPGYFPTALGTIIAVLGVVLIMRGVRHHTDIVNLKHVGRPLLIIGAFLAFALLAEPAGLLVAALAVVLISSHAAHDFNWAQALILGGFLAAVCVAIFVYGLGLNLKVWPG